MIWDFHCEKAGESICLQSFNSITLCSAEVGQLMFSLNIVMGKKVSAVLVSHRFLGDKSKSAEEIK